MSRVVPLEWDGPHGLSLGGSLRGVHAPSKIGYMIHDHLSDGGERFVVYRMGVNNPIAKRGTVSSAKEAAQQDFEGSVLAALAGDA